MRKETAEKCKFIAGLFFFGGEKADIIRSSNESRPKLRNEIKQQDKKIKSEDERMKKKVAAIFMASIMACSMAACGSSGGSSDSGKTDSKDKSTASSTAENGSGEVEKIIVSFPTWTGAPADTEKVQEAINDITRDKIGVEIELSITDFGSFNQNTTLALSANEEIDVLACVGFPYATGIQQGYLSDLEENDLLATYGPDIAEAVGQDNIDACRVNGVLYGLPSNRDIAQGRGCARSQPSISMVLATKQTQTMRS